MNNTSECFDREIIQFFLKKIIVARMATTDKYEFDKDGLKIELLSFYHLNQPDHFGYLPYYFQYNLTGLEYEYTIGENGYSDTKIMKFLNEAE